MVSLDASQTVSLHRHPFLLRKKPEGNGEVLPDFPCYKKQQPESTSSSLFVKVKDLNCIDYRMNWLSKILIQIEGHVLRGYDNPERVAHIGEQALFDPQHPQF